jgi:hypothetical protein|uniref:hypothetical protein n=1 Tax=Aliarcobacter sp. TaxID=2321116 RepID=UPI00404889D4
MKKNLNLFLTLLITTIGVLFLTGCGPMKEPTPSMQGNLYTQVNMWEEKGKILATNYQRGRLIPVNSLVTINGYSSKAVSFTINGETMPLELVNVEKFTRLSTEQLSLKLFSKSKVNLSKFSKKARAAIEFGNIENGMTKSEVLVSRGLPPAHVTPNTQSNLWKYWQNRWVTRNVEFKNDRVSGLAGWGTGNN